MPVELLFDIRTLIALLLFSLALYAFHDASASARKARLGDERHGLVAVAGYSVAAFSWLALMGFVVGVMRG